jgi:hypothetical protein
MPLMPNPFQSCRNGFPNDKSGLIEGEKVSYGQRARRNTFMGCAMNVINPAAS